MTHQPIKSPIYSLYHIDYKIPRLNDLHNIIENSTYKIRDCILHRTYVCYMCHWAFSELVGQKIIGQVISGLLVSFKSLKVIYHFTYTLIWYLQLDLQFVIYFRADFDCLDLAPYHHYYHIEVAHYGQGFGQFGLAYQHPNLATLHNTVLNIENYVIEFLKLKWAEKGSLIMDPSVESEVKEWRHNDVTLDAVTS